MYKYRLMLKLEKRYEIELKINEIMEKEHAKTAVFFPYDHDYAMLHCDNTKLLKESIIVIKRSTVFRKIWQGITRLKRTVMLAAPFYTLFKKIGGIAKIVNKKTYKVGIMDDHPENSFLMNYFGNNIFLDEKELPKDDVLFITLWEKDKKKLEIGKEYNAESIYDGKNQLSWDLLWNRIIRRFVPIWIKTAFFSLFEEPIIT